MAFLSNIIITRKQPVTVMADTQRLSKGQRHSEHLTDISRSVPTRALQVMYSYGPLSPDTEWGNAKFRDFPRAHSKQTHELEFNSGSLAPQPIFLATAFNLIQRLLVLQ